MILVVAEKAIAGKRIAELLADSEVKAHHDGQSSYLTFLRAGKEYAVLSLRGHVKDVDFPRNYAPWLGTDLRNLVKARVDYVEKERGILFLLKRLAPQVQTVVFATDSDREGESIALEALETLQEKNKEAVVLRANFSAITKEDLEEAFSKLGKLDFHLAHSADARREIDLIWGAVLTRFLSLISGRLGKSFISAGRVQSPTLALIVNREKERLAFQAQSYWEVEAWFEKDKEKFMALHKEGRLWDQKRAEEIMLCKDSHGTVSRVSKSKRVLEKPLPFNTTLFLRAATAIGFSAGKAMSLAEELYQLGFTSYPRTDNTVYPASLPLRKTLEKLLRVEGLAEDAKKLLAREKLVPSAGKKATQDHPPIHPVDAPSTSLSPQQYKVYELICRRFFATLADQAVTENVSAEIVVKKEPFIARGQTYLEKGWKAFYPYSKAEELILPQLEEGEKVPLLELNLLSKETIPPARYSQGTLIKLMEELGLGTKSTRHVIIQKLFARRYIEGQKAIIPSKLAFAITEALERHSKKVVEPEMTAEVEKEMDVIAAGKKSKAEVVQESRELLGEILDGLLQNKDLIGKSIRLALRSDSELLPCTREGCAGQLLVRTGISKKRFLGCSTYPECRTSYPLPQFGSLVPTGQVCEQCHTPFIQVNNQRSSFTMCLATDCPSKAAWRERAAQKKAAQQNAQPPVVPPARAPQSLPKKTAFRTPVKKKKA